MYSFFSRRASTHAFSEKRISKSPVTLSSFNPTRAKKALVHEFRKRNEGNICRELKEKHLHLLEQRMARRSHASSTVQHMGLAISATLLGKESGF